MRFQHALSGLVIFSVSLVASARQTPAPDALTGAWRAVAGASQDADAIRAAIRSVAAGAGAQDMAPGEIAEASRGIVLTALTSRGCDASEAAVLAAAVEAEMRAALGTLAATWPVPDTVTIGPLEFTRGRIRSMLGPREGRDRNEVVRKLEAAAHAQHVTLTNDELLDLVPLMAAIAEVTRMPDTYLEPLREAIVSAGQQQ